MSIDAVPNSLTTAVQFNVPKDHLLVYDPRHGGRFSFIAKGNPLEAGCTSNLKTISDRITKLVLENEFGQLALDAKARIYLAANIELLNPLFEKYNELIAQSGWLNFLDYLVWVLTFGHHQLSCKLLGNHRAEEVNRDLYNNSEYFETFLKDPSMDEFLDKWKSHLNFEYGLDNTNFSILSKEENIRIVKLAKLSNHDNLTSQTLINLFALACQRDEDQEYAETLLQSWQFTMLDNHTRLAKKFFDCFSKMHSEAQKNEKDAKSIHDLAGSKFIHYLRTLSVPTLQKLLKSPELIVQMDIVEPILRYLWKSPPFPKNEIHLFVEKGLKQKPNEFLVIIDNFRKEGISLFNNSAALIGNLLKQVTLPKIPELAMAVFANALEQNLQGSPRFYGIALIQFFNNGFDLEAAWKALQPKPELRIKLQSFLEENSKLEGFNNLAKRVYQIGVKNYQQLTKIEKSDFFQCLKRREVTLQPSRAIFFDFIEHIGQTQSHNKNVSEIPKILATIKKLNELNDPELKQLVYFCNDISFNVLNNKGQMLRESLPSIQIVKFLAKDINARHISENTKFAVQLCMAHAFEGMEKVQKEIMNIFSNLKIYQIPKEEFDALVLENKRPKEFKLFAEMLKKDPDSMLATASEEQLETYYGPAEKGLTVDDSHLKKQIAQKEAVPPLPPNTTARYEELIDMFNKINFSNPQGPDYVNPAELSDDGAKVSAERLVMGIRNFVNQAKNPKGYSGVPDPAKDPEGYKRICNDLDLYLKHTIIVLRKRSQKDKNLILIWLAGAGLHCGGKFISVAQDLYCQVTGAAYSVDGETLFGVLIRYLTEARRGIFDSRINKLTDQTHARIAAMKHVGKWFGLPEANSFQYEDPFDKPPYNTFFREKKDFDSFYQKCRQDYNATAIINTFVRRFDGTPGTKPSITAAFRQGSLEQWFKEELTKGKKFKNDKEKAEADVVALGTVYNDDLTRFRRKWIVKLLVAHKILKLPSKLNPANWSLFSKPYWE